MIYDIGGRTVSKLFDGFQRAGSYINYWKAVNSDGRRLPSGVYFAQLKYGSYVQTIKVMLIQ